VKELSGMVLRDFMGVVDRDSDYSGFLIEQGACANDVWMCHHEFGYEIGETGYTDLLDFLSKYRLLAATNFSSPDSLITWRSLANAPGMCLP
jgi:hypothetical protein